MPNSLDISNQLEASITELDLISQDGITGAEVLDIIRIITDLVEKAAAVNKLSGAEKKQMAKNVISLVEDKYKLREKVSELIDYLWDLIKGNIPFFVRPIVSLFVKKILKKKIWLVYDFAIEFVLNKV